MSRHGGRHEWCAGAGSLLLVALATAQEPLAEPTYVQTEGRHVADVIHADVDGDGRGDLVIATGVKVGGQSAGQRWLQVYLRREGSPAFAARPDHTLEVIRDVVAYAVADVHPHPGRELVLFSPSLAAGVYWDAGEQKPTVFRIGSVRLLWQPAWWVRTIDQQRAVADLDGDGRDDLLVPEPDGYRALLQRVGEDGVVTWDVAELSVPQRRTSDREEGEARLKAQADTLRLRLREDERDKVFVLLECADRVPAPTVADWDGDGDRDVIALADQDLCVWIYEDGFASDPTFQHPLPKFQASMLNPSNFVVIADVNGDHRLDVVFVAGQVKDDEVKSQIEIYLQTADGTVAADPADRLLLQGFVDVPRLDDIDGDGRPELVVGSLRPDLIGTISAGGSGSVDAQLNVFRNEFTAEAGRFARPIAMVEPIGLTGDVLRSRVRDRVLATFFRDVNGDGVRDLLQRTQLQHVLVRAGAKVDTHYALGEVLWELHVDADARVMLVNDGDRGGVIAIEDEQVIYAEFR